MAGTLQRANAWAHTHEGRKLIRYTAVSGISTICSFTVLFFWFGVFKIWTQVPSTIFANAVATIPSYYLNRTWAWGKSGRSHLMREVVPFWTMSALGIGVSIIGAKFAKVIAVHHHLPHWEATALLLIANVASFGVFWVLKLLLFNKLFHFELEEFDEHLTEEEHRAAVDKP
jgi:putative flippase GtrA